MWPHPAPPAETDGAGSGRLAADDVVAAPAEHREAVLTRLLVEPPEHADYDFWCGPSEKLPFVPARFHWNWRWHLAYGGGQLMDWIGHHNDIAHWGMGMERSGPVEALLGVRNHTAYDSSAAGHFIHDGKGYVVFGSGHLVGTHRRVVCVCALEDLGKRPQQIGTPERADA